MAGLFQGCRNSRRPSRRVSFLFIFMVSNIVITRAKAELQHKLLLSTVMLVVGQLLLKDLPM